MEITIIKMSYLIEGKFVSLSVKSDGSEYNLYIDATFIEESFESPQEAVFYGMRIIENGETYGNESALPIGRNE